MGCRVWPVLVDDVHRWEVGFRIDGSLNAVGTAREAGEAKAGRVALELLACFMHQVGGAEKTDARCRYVVGSKLDGAKHASGVLERPSDVSVSGDPNPVRESSHAGAFWSGLDWSNEVGLARRDRKARSGIPDDSVLGLLVPDALEEVDGVIPRVTERVLNPGWNAAELFDRQSGNVRGPVTEQRLTFTVGIVSAVAKASTASRLTGLSISEIGSSLTE
jgi:hypothetical protein